MRRFLSNYFDLLFHLYLLSFITLSQLGQTEILRYSTFRAVVGLAFCFLIHNVTEIGQLVHELRLKVIFNINMVAMGALFYSPVDFTDASDLNTLMQV